MRHLETPCASHDNPIDATREYLWVAPAGRDACGYYRMAMPAGIFFQKGEGLWMNSRIPGNPDWVRKRDAQTGGRCLAIVTQRQYEPHQVQWMKAYRDAGFYVVMDIDDLLWHGPEQSRFRLSSEQRKALRVNLELAGHVVTTNRYLAEQIKLFAPAVREVRILRNRVTEGDFCEPRPRQPGERLRVAYMGGMNHLGDIQQITRAIKETAKEIEWFFFGTTERVVDKTGKLIRERTRVPQALRGLGGRVNVLPPQKVDQFLSFCKTQQFHLALAPLEDHPFNRAKSDLKLLEAGAMGVPCIASAVQPYRESPNPLVKPGAGAWKTWIEEIRAYAIDEQRRLADAHAMRTYAWTRRFEAEDTAEEVLSAWMPAKAREQARV